MINALRYRCFCLCFSGLLSVSFLEAAPVELPFAHPFQGDGNFPSPWTASQSSATTLTLSNGQVLAVAEGETDHAFVERELQVDNATLTARIYGCAFMYFVWDKDNWIGVGKISPTPFGRIASIVTHDGKTSETDHRGVFANAPHYLQLQLAEDGVRLQYRMEEASDWNSLRVVERFSGMKGAPKSIILGKNYEIGREGISIYHNYNNSNGPRGVLDDIQIVQTPTEAVKLTADEHQWLYKTRPDPVAQLLKLNRDPDFESVATYYPEMKHVRDLTGVPGQQDDIGVDWLGRLDNSPWVDPIASFTFDGKPFAEKGSDVKRSLEGGYLPMISLQSQQGDVQLSQSVFGWSEGFNNTGNLYGYVKLSAWNSHEPGRVPTRAVMHVKGKEVPIPLTPEASGKTSAWFRYKHPDPASIEMLNGEEFEKTRSEVRSHWTKLLAAASPFRFPESRVDNAYKAWIAYAMLNTDYVKDHYEVHDGSGFYDSVFGYSASLHAMALDLYGMHDYVKDLIAGQLHFQQDDGLYLQDCGLPDHGSLTLAIALHYQKTRDEEWLKSVAPQLTKLCDWIIRMRAENRTTDPKTRGLIKFRPYNDHPQPVFNYLGNTYCVRGLEEAAKTFAALGESEKAERYSAEAAAYRKDVLASMDVSKLVHNGTEMLPIEPDTHRLLKLSKYKGGEYYGLVASNLFEHEFFEDNDPRGALYINMLENHGGLAAGACEFQEGIDHAYTYGYWINRMNAGEPRKTVLGLYSSLAYGMSRETYSPVEVTMHKTAQNHLTLPHTYSCTQQLRLLRNMLLQEKGNQLIIGAGIPESWLEPGRKIEAVEAPTEFGPVSLEIVTNADESVTVKLDPPGRNAPNSIRIDLRKSFGKKISGVSASNGSKISFDGQTINLGTIQEPVTLSVSF